MPDITLCMNKNCPLKKRCGRFMGEPDNLWQSFANFQPFTFFQYSTTGGPDVPKTECDYFWDIKEYPYKLKKGE